MHNFNEKKRFKFPFIFKRIISAKKQKESSRCQTPTLRNGRMLGAL